MTVLGDDTCCLGAAYVGIDPANAQNCYTNCGNGATATYGLMFDGWAVKIHLCPAHAALWTADVHYNCAHLVPAPYPLGE